MKKWLPIPFELKSKTPLCMALLFILMTGLSLKASDEKPAEDPLEVEIDSILDQIDKHYEEGDFKSAFDLSLNSGRVLREKYPDRSDSAILFSLATGFSSPEQALLLADEIESYSVDTEKMKVRADQIRKTIARLGHPLALEFETTDGDRFDLQSLKNKVVVIDFWATWCPTCITDLPHLQSAYKDYHADGLEVVGISFDKSMDKLKAFIEKEGLPWPQYFDGKGWDNQLGQEFGIRMLPTVWIIDRNGNLRYVNGSLDLKSKIVELLGENS